MREMLQRKRPHRYLSTVYDSNPYPNRCSLLRVSVQIWYSIIVLFIKRYSDVEKKYFDTLMIMIYQIYLIGAFLWTFPRFNDERNVARQNRPMYGIRMKLKSRSQNYYLHYFDIEVRGTRNQTGLHSRMTVYCSESLMTTLNDVE